MSLSDKSQWMDNINLGSGQLLQIFCPPSIDQEYQDLKQQYVLGGIKKDVVDFVANCLCCQQVNTKHLIHNDLIQILPIHKWKMEQINIDFVHGFRRTLYCSINIGSLLIDCPNCLISSLFQILFSAKRLDRIMFKRWFIFFG